MENSSSGLASPRPAFRLVRYEDLIPCLNAFIDTRTPGSDKKENFTIIGPGVSENPAQHVHISEPHGFNIGGARQPPNCVNSQHSHKTAEVFFVHKGTWSFDLGEHGDEGSVILTPGDLISIPVDVFRGFKNVGQDTGFLWAILGNDDPGRVLWAPNVFKMAEHYGLILLDDGSLVDVAQGETMPAGKARMPVTTAEQVSALEKLDGKALERFCVRRGASNNLDGLLIGQGTQINWPHGFSVESGALEPGETRKIGDIGTARVLFVHTGSLDASSDDETIAASAGATISISYDNSCLLSNSGTATTEYLLVTGDAAN